MNSREPAGFRTWSDLEQKMSRFFNSCYALLSIRIGTSTMKRNKTKCLCYKVLRGLLRQKALIVCSHSAPVHVQMPACPQALKPMLTDVRPHGCMPTWMYDTCAGRDRCILHAPCTGHALPPALPLLSLSPLAAQSHGLSTDLIGINHSSTIKQDRMLAQPTLQSVVVKLMILTHRR